MDVVLLQDMEKLGLRGEVVSVARGYMRNYLQPRQLAEPATPALIAEIARRDAERARHEARSVDQAREIADTLTKTVLRFEVKAGPQGVLFGSITPTDIADELWRVRKVRVDRRKIELADPIKRVGRFEIPIEVFQDVVVEVKTLVVPEGGELPPEEAGEMQALAAEPEATVAEPAVFIEGKPVSPDYAVEDETVAEEAPEEGGPAAESRWASPYEDEDVDDDEYLDRGHRRR